MSQSGAMHFINRDSNSCANVLLNLLQSLQTRDISASLAFYRLLIKNLIY